MDQRRPVSNMSCFHCKKRGHLKKNCPRIQCFKCKAYGHICANCPSHAHVRGERRTDPKREFVRTYYPYVHTRALRHYRYRSSSVASSTSSISSAGSSHSAETLLPVDGPKQESQVRDEEATERVAESLHMFLYDRNQPSVLLINKKLEDFQARGTCPREQQLLVLPAGLAEMQRGDFDVIVIHSQYGYILIEVKATGDNLELFEENESWKNVLKAVRRAADRLEKGRRALVHLQPGHRRVGIVTTLAIPNVLRDNLRKVLGQDSELRVRLAKCLAPATAQPGRVDVEALCLCSDDLPQKGHYSDDRTSMLFSSWWSKLLIANKLNPTHPLHPDDYELIVEAFCRKEQIRTFPDAVCDLSRKFGELRLDRQQLKVIESSDQYVFVTGPPGSGKSLVLAHQAAKWFRSGEKVFIIYKHGKNTTQPAAQFLFHSINSILDPVNFPLENVLSFYDEYNADLFLTEEVLGYRADPEENTRRAFRGHDRKKKNLMMPVEVRRNADYSLPGSDVPQGPINFVIDEVNKRTLTKGPGAVMYDVINAIKERFPKARVWCAGALPSYCPEHDFRTKFLNHSYRCPPKIQRLLKALEPFCQTDKESNVFHYVTCCTDVPAPVSTDQPSARAASDRRDHRWRLPGDGFDPCFISHDGHGRGEIWDCRSCAHNVAKYLWDLLADGARAASSGPQLQQQDILIVVCGPALYNDMNELTHSELYKQLTSSEGGQRRVKVLRIEDKFDLLSSTMHMMHVRAVAGVEKAIVVYVPCLLHQSPRVPETGGSASGNGTTRRAQEHPPCQAHPGEQQQEPRDARLQQDHSFSPHRIKRILRGQDCLSETQKNNLSRLGHLNLHWLWYAASRSLAHLVVLHF